MSQGHDAVKTIVLVETRSLSFLNLIAGIIFCFRGSISVPHERLESPAPCFACRSKCARLIRYPRGSPASVQYRTRAVRRILSRMFQNSVTRLRTWHSSTYFAFALRHKAHTWWKQWGLSLLSRAYTLLKESTIVWVRRLCSEPCFEIFFFFVINRGVCSFVAAFRPRASP